VASDPHDDLLAWFADRPGVVSAECSGYGQVTLQMEGERYPMSAHCPVCERATVRGATARFIPQRFREPIVMPEAVTEWAQRGAKAEGLYLAGQVGTGKTHTAWMAVAAWCLAASVPPRPAGYAPEYVGGNRHGASVIFARMVDLLDDFRPGDASVQHVRDCQNAKLLVIDDLGAEKPSEWTQERLYSVVDHRYVNCLPLIVTGNLPPAKLAEQTGDRVASRLAEMCTVVPMTGTDRRRS
jgi:DNA replication protein DnaC